MVLKAKAQDAPAAASDKDTLEVIEPGSAQRILKSVALMLARHEIRNIRRWFEDFDRDILLPILLGEIALHNIGALETGGERGNGSHGAEAAGAAVIEFSSDVDDAYCELKPCNAYSIAAATGLPRETVRRKIVRLIELGWIVRRGNGHLFITRAAVDHFGALLSSRQLGELLETAERVRALLDADAR